MRTPVTAVLSIAIVLLGAPTAISFDEVEPNDTIGQANEVDVPEDVEGVRSSSLDVDFFLFTGLSPGGSYFATLDNPFLGLGWFASDGTLLDSVAFEGTLELFDLVPDESGELILGVCGHVPPDENVLDCTPDADGAGPYVLTLPEPRIGTLSMAALAALASLARHRHRLR